MTNWIVVWNGVQQEYNTPEVICKTDEHGNCTFLAFKLCSRESKEEVQKSILSYFGCYKEDVDGVYPE